MIKWKEKLRKIKELNDIDLFILFTELFFFLIMETRKKKKKYGKNLYSVYNK